MGVVNFGIPEDEAKYLKELLSLDIFVEGGTYYGETAKSMSKNFRKVFTIEKSDTVYDIAKENLKNISNISLLNGDTREHLHNILVGNDNILFWLDAHWSGGQTYGKEDECPLIKELEIIFEHNKNYVILIDDARLFLSPPSLPHKIENWPSLKELVAVIPSDWDFVVLKDVIYLIPDKHCKDFKHFIQKITNQKKITNQRNKQFLLRSINFIHGFKSAISIFLKRQKYLRFKTE